MVTFIEEHRGEYGVESICKVLPIVPATYYAHKERQTNPEKRCARAKRDEKLEGEIDRVWKQNHSVYGAYKMWRELRRQGIEVARCTVERLMKKMGFEERRGVVRGNVQPSPMSMRSAPRTWLNATSKSMDPISFGSRT